MPFCAGALTGVLSAWGVGGGTLLLLVMTLFLDVPQRTAQAVNLLYFLPTAAGGLYFHWRGGLLRREVLGPALPWAALAAAAGAWLSCAVDVSALRRPFGLYLLAAGAMALFRKKGK